MLQGQKVLLRGKRISDAVNDYAWRCDAELARLDATTPLEASFSEFLASYQGELRYSNPHRQRFAIETLDGKYIGNCTYYDLNERRSEVENFSIRPLVLLEE